MPVEIGKAQVVQHFANNGGRKVALFGLGPMLRLAKTAAAELAKDGYDTAVINPRFFKPLDAQIHRYFGEAADIVATLEDHVAMGGYGSAVLECLNEADIHKPMVRLAWPDQFVEHATTVDYLREKHGLTVARLVSDVKSRLEHEATATVTGHSTARAG
jgi:1-deoxy-D-xylulose-5-phosphate synthase